MGTVHREFPYLTGTSYCSNICLDPASVSGQGIAYAIATFEG